MKPVASSVALILLLSSSLPLAHAGQPTPAAPAPTAPAPAAPAPQGPAGPALPTPGTPSEALEAAAAALQAGDHARAAALAGPVARSPIDLDRADRAEAWRLLGLSLFFLGRLEDAEQAFLACLKLDLDARLDPSLVPPEALTFFEDVRARHAAELRRLKPPPRRYFVLSVLPPFGQFQNGDRRKGWILAGAETAALATHVASYLMLRRWCSTEDRTCEGHVDGARTMRDVNLYSGIAFIGLVTYGVIDGLAGYRRQTARLESPAPPTLTVMPLSEGGAVLTLGGSF
jgi:hypothetical protein